MKEIALSKGYVALVDDADYERVAAFKWFAQERNDGHRTRVYAARQVWVEGKRTTTSMHVFITGVATGIDHEDGNGLNNQRFNLRRANQQQNMANRRKGTGSSRYKGVSWHKGGRKWRALIQKDGTSYNIGTYRDEADAATAYNFKAEELFGPFAKYNVPVEITA